MAAPLPSSSTSTTQPGIPDGSYESAILNGEIKVDPKLGDNNWQTWSEGMELLLAAKMLWDKVDGTVPRPCVTTRPKDHKAWSFDDTQARMWIYVNCKPTQQSHLRNIKTSYHAWEALKKAHAAKHRGRINFLVKSFYNYKMKEGESVDNVASELKNIQHSIREIKHSEAPTDLAVAINLMSAFDNEAYHLAVFYLEREPNLTLDLALESLKSVEQSMRDKKAAGKLLETAQRAEDKEPRKCYYCGRFGHVKVYCFDWLDTPEGRAYTRENPDKQRRAKSSSRKEEKSKSRPVPTKKECSASVSRGKKSGSRVKAAAEELESASSKSSQDQDQRWVAEGDNEEKPVSMARETGKNENVSHDWMLDSGCSRHMTPDRDLFVTITPYRKPVRIANGERVYSEGLGDVEVTIDGAIVKMSDVLYVPAFDSNLLSISALNRKGLAVLFQGNVVKILRKQICVATGIMRGRIYFLESFKQPS